MYTSHDCESVSVPNQKPILPCSSPTWGPFKRMTKCCTQDVSIKRREEQPVHSGGHAATFSNAGFYMGFWWFWLLVGAQTWQEVEATLLLAVPVMCWKSVRLCGVWRMVLVNQLACWIVAFDGVWMYFICEHIWYIMSIMYSILVSLCVIKLYDLIDFHSAWSVLTRMMPPLSLAVVVRQSTRLQEL